MRKEQGSAIIEGAIIFPVIFVLIIIMMTFGNAYYQRSRVEAIVDVNTIECAAYSQDALLTYLSKKGSVPDNVNDMPSIEPYKYLFHGAESNLNVSLLDAKLNIEEQINNLNGGYFKGMDVHIEKCEVVYQNSFIYQTIRSEVICKINMPFRMLGSSEILDYRFSVVNEIPVSDSPEFIRNVDMVIDYLEKYGVMEAIDNGIGKLKSAMAKVQELFKR